MNARDYADLAAACDQLLRARGTSFTRIALPALHVINEHPSLLRPYEPLVSGVAAPDVAALAAEPPAHGPVVLRVARALKRALQDAPEAAAWRRARAPESVDVLIVSRLASRAQLAGPDDFYFGALQRLLSARGVTSVLALVNHLPPQAPLTPQDWPSLGSARTVLPRALAAGAEVRLWGQSVLAGRALLRAGRSAGSPLLTALARLAGRQALSGGALQNLRLHGSVAALCRRLSPRIVITTYEGDASERAIWHAARLQGQPLCVGYQHTALREHAHAIRRRVNAPGIPCDPDVILTLGEITRAALADSEALRPVHLINYGSHRRVSVARVAGERAPLCLVLPDGDPRECHILFEFAMACARRMPDVTFLLRPHPVTNFDATVLAGIGGGDVPANVMLSREGTLEQHCARARFCLYRGSSAALQAVLAGVKPFYLARPGELCFDPLYQLHGWRVSVTTPAEFCGQAGTADTSPDSEAARAARRFCDRYVSPVRTEALDELLILAATVPEARTSPLRRAG
jgi:hypothetical protein